MLKSINLPQKISVNQTLFEIQKLWWVEILHVGPYDDQCLVKWFVSRVYVFLDDILLGLLHYTILGLWLWGWWFLERSPPSSSVCFFLSLVFKGRDSDLVYINFWYLHFYRVFQSQRWYIYTVSETDLYNNPLWSRALISSLCILTCKQGRVVSLILPPDRICKVERITFL